jgi:predicted DsbA family dithiol-disulfide isomerase
MPLKGKEKAPHTPDNPRVGQRLKAAGAAVGIDFTGLTDRYPNTVDAHRLLTFALQKGGAAVQDRLSEILFRSYFTDGVYPGEDNLVKLGVEAGLAEAEVSDFLDTEELRAEVFAEDRKVKQAGVHGVPYFYFNGNDYGLSGAQDPATFISAFDKATAQ